MKFIVLLAIFFLVIACAQAVTNLENEVSLSEITRTQIAEQSTDDCVTMDFRYLVTQNELYTAKVRHIEIFLDEKAFSEENLKKLFRYLSDKNPEPKHLTVVVNTNWQQLSLPSDCPPIGMSNMPERPNKYDYHQAVFYRRDRNGTVENFRYNPILKVHDANFKRVIMKGKAKE